jgi:hypothetical protein
MYEKRAFTYDREAKQKAPILNSDGSQRKNANYISFLQVISTYFEVIDDQGNEVLNIFLTGGGLTTDRETGERSPKAGYTLVLPGGARSIGERFMREYYQWSMHFGLNRSQRSQPQPVSERSSGGPRGRHLDFDEFVDPASEQQPAEPSFE